MNKKEANRKLETAVMKSNPFLVSVALSEGASIGYKNGTFFGTACRLGNLEIVEMFVLDYSFVKKANHYQKNYVNPSFHDGFSYAIANGRLDVVQFLNESPIYQNLKKLDTYIVNGLEFAVNNQHPLVVDYILRHSRVMDSQEFKEKEFSQDNKYFIEPIIFSIKLEAEISTENTKHENTKMKI